MAIPKITGAQRDFSGGELDVSLKRADENPIMKIGARQLANWRVLSSGVVKNRPGRTALFLETGRIDEVLMSPGNTFFLAFGNGYLRVYNAAGAQVFSSTVLGDGVTDVPWTTATVKNIVFAVAAGSQLAVYICYADGAPANVPQVLSWDGVSQTSTWALTTFTETVTAGGQKRTPFYRLAPQNITLLPSAVSGNINITFSAAVLTAGMVGTRIRFCGKQLTITGVTNGTAGTATVNETLPPGQALTVSATVGTFNIGDEITGSTTGALGILTAVPTQQTIVLQVSVLRVGNLITGSTSGATGTVISIIGGFVATVLLSTSTLFQAGETITITGGGSATISSVTAGGIKAQLLTNADGTVAEFAGTETIVGPLGSATLSSVTTGVPQAVSIWDQEVMNLYRGYPISVFYDQNRLGLCNFPALPDGIGWSAIGLPLDFYVLALPDNAIFELAPGKSQVLFVQPGMESSEFVFCDNAVYYIPITVSNPLVPGSVSFNLLSQQGCFGVQPRPAEQSIMYVKAGGAQIAAVQAPGAYYRPYVIDNISEFHSHLFTASPPIAIACPSATNQFEELYAYILLANGNVVIGKYGIRQGLLDPGPEGKPKVGWLPWSGAGTVEWVSAYGADVIFTTSYAPNNVTAVSVVERLDNTQYVDGALLVNSLPAPFTPPGGKGPLYYFPGPSGTVTLMDQSTRMMGTYEIDANGNIVPQNNGGENLASAQLVAGQPWTATLEPFVPDAAPGQDVHQRMFKRRVSRMAAYVSNSTGFLMARLFSGPITPTSPALGTVMNQYRVTAWNMGDIATNPPPLREQAYRWRPIGRAYDPRVAIIKDTPGPLTVHEIGIEASI